MYAELRAQESSLGIVTLLASSKKLSLGRFAWACLLDDNPIAGCPPHTAKIPVVWKGPVLQCYEAATPDQHSHAQALGRTHISVG